MKKKPIVWVMFSVVFISLGGLVLLAESNSVVPKTMTKMVIADIGPDVPKGSFAARPKTTYLSGTRYGRIEEEDDPKEKLHQLILVSEPDIWMINLADKTAKHMVDPGPTFDLHFPAFEVKGLPKLLFSFELGHEFDFFEKVSKKKKYPKVVDGKKYDSYSVGVGDYTVMLLTEPGKEIPIFAFLFNKDAVVDALEYLNYQAGLPFNASLFKVPAGISVSEDKGEKN